MPTHPPRPHDPEGTTVRTHDTCPSLRRYDDRPGPRLHLRRRDSIRVDATPGCSAQRVGFHGSLDSNASAHFYGNPCPRPGSQIRATIVGTVISVQGRKGFARQLPPSHHRGKGFEEVALEVLRVQRPHVALGAVRNAGESLLGGRHRIATRCFVMMGATISHELGTSPPPHRSVVQQDIVLVFNKARAPTNECHQRSDSTENARVSSRATNREHELPCKQKPQLCRSEGGRDWDLTAPHKRGAIKLKRNKVPDLCPEPRAPLAQASKMGL